MVGVQVGESAARPVSPGQAPVDDDGPAELVLAGTRVTGEFRCAGCGYGAVVQRVLPQCPMCAGDVWESRRPVPVAPAG